MLASLRVLSALLVLVLPMCHCDDTKLVEFARQVPLDTLSDIADGMSTAPGSLHLRGGVVVRPPVRKSVLAQTGSATSS